MRAGEAVPSRGHALRTGAVVVGASVVALAAFEVRWQRSALTDLYRQPGGWWGALLVVVASAVVHEWLHVLAWTLPDRRPRPAIAFRPSWRKMGIVAQVIAPVPLRVYRAGLAAPALLMGALPMLSGVLTGNGLWVVWSVFFSVECFSDLSALFATIGLSADVTVISHPTRAGCRFQT